MRNGLFLSQYNQFYCFFYCSNINLEISYCCHSTFDFCVTSFLITVCVTKTNLIPNPPFLRTLQSIVSKRLQNHRITLICLCCISSRIGCPPPLVKNSRHHSASSPVSGSWDGEKQNTKNTDRVISHNKINLFRSVYTADLITKSVNEGLFPEFWGKISLYSFWEIHHQVW